MPSGALDAPQTRPVGPPQALLRLDFHGAQPILGIADVNGGPDAGAYPEAVEIGLIAERKLHGHGLHPVADFLMTNGGGAHLVIEADHFTANFAEAFGFGGAAGAGRQEAES